MVGRGGVAVGEIQQASETGFDFDSKIKNRAKTSLGPYITRGEGGGHGKS